MSENINETLHVTQVPHPNRRHKDYLFRHIFKEKEALLQLYNAINGTSYDDPNELEINTMKDVVYIYMKNDLSFIISSTLNLYEHMSTDSPNLPLRGLIYTVSVLHSEIERREENLVGHRRIWIPVPQYIVFYNGDAPMPDIQELKLSDSFEKVEGERKYKEPSLEYTCKMININLGYLTLAAFAKYKRADKKAGKRVSKTAYN